MARQIPLRLICKWKPCFRIAAASAWGKPCALFMSTPSVRASGPTCTAAALGTLLGNGNGDRFGDMIRDRSTVVLAVGFPALASRRSRVARTLTPRTWGRLTPGGTLRRFQFLLQAPNLFAQSCVLILRALFFLQCLIESFLGPAQFLHQLPNPANWVQ